MHKHTLSWIDIGVEFVIHALIELASISGIQHVFTNTCLPISRLGQNVDHSSGNCTNDLLVVFQQSTIRLSVDALSHRQVLNHYKRQRLVWVWVLFQTDHLIAYPSSDDRNHFPGTINVTVTPILMNHELLARLILEVEALGVCRYCVVWGSKNAIT